MFALPPVPPFSQKSHAALLAPDFWEPCFILHKTHFARSRILSDFFLFLSAFLREMSGLSIVREGSEGGDCQCLFEFKSCFRSQEYFSSGMGAELALLKRSDR